MAEPQASPKPLGLGVAEKEDVPPQSNIFQVCTIVLGEAGVV